MKGTHGCGDGLRTARSPGLQDHHLFRQLLRAIYPASEVGAWPSRGEAGSKLKILITGQRGMIIIARPYLTKRSI